MGCQLVTLTVSHQHFATDHGGDGGLDDGDGDGVLSYTTVSSMDLYVSKTYIINININVVVHYYIYVIALHNRLAFSGC